MLNSDKCCKKKKKKKDLAKVVISLSIDPRVLELKGVPLQEARKKPLL